MAEQVNAKLTDQPIDRINKHDPKRGRLQNT